MMVQNKNNGTLGYSLPLLIVIVLGYKQLFTFLYCGIFHIPAEDDFFVTPLELLDKRISLFFFLHIKHLQLVTSLKVWYHILKEQNYRAYKQTKPCPKFKFS